MTDEMREWFHHLATVEQEIRFDIERYETDHVTPEQLRPADPDAPEAGDHRGREDAAAQDGATQSYSGRRLQTILFNHRDRSLARRRTSTPLAHSRTGDGDPRHHQQVRAGITVVGPVPSAAIAGLPRGLPLPREQPRPRRRADRASTSTAGGSRRRAHPLPGRRHGPQPPLRTSRDAGSRAGRAGRLHQPRSAQRDRRRRRYADIKALMSRRDRVIDLDIAPSDLRRDRRSGDIARLRNLPARRRAG